jgi:tRNA pseudouridine55 synthase
VLFFISQIVYNVNGDEMDGFLLIDKPKDLTSRDVVTYVKHKLGCDKIGHTGTLDPFATGLLILCLGKATKLSDYVMKYDKTYEGTIVFGHHYDTYDVTGTILQSNTPNFDEKTLFMAMESFEKNYHQQPPIYSAIKKDGKTSYKMARKGHAIELDKRPVEIYTFKPVGNYANHKIDFIARVSKGTYLRSLAVDLAEKLDTFGALLSLRRLQIGTYNVDHATKMTDVLDTDMILLNDFLKNMPKLILNDYMIDLVKNGVVLDERQAISVSPFVVCNEKNDMIALYDEYQPGRYKPVVIL